MFYNFILDKLAALWPFLGIVAEVVVLCTIIFIYEKKRNKDANAEEDVNQDGSVKICFLSFCSAFKASCCDVAKEII